MRTVKVKFEWTILIRVSDSRSTFKKVLTETGNFTFEEIEQIHSGNYKGIGNPIRDFAFLTDDLRNRSVKMNVNTLREKVENTDAIYVVELDYPWLRFSPVMKTKREHSAMENAISA